jgi:hypothetical protein
MERFAWVGV